jgi:asparagine synthase (glutamine-hydrolysing)
MGMAANIENRVPFLDHRLVEFAYSLPKERKTGREAKIILKEVAEKYFSRDFIYRPKVGFGQPIAAWLRNKRGLGRYFDLFEKGAAPQYIQYHVARELAAEHMKGTADHSTILWSLVTLEIWMRVFLEKQKPATLLKRFV